MYTMRAFLRQKNLTLSFGQHWLCFKCFGVICTHSAGLLQLNNQTFSTKINGKPLWQFKKLFHYTRKSVAFHWGTHKIKYCWYSKCTSIFNNSINMQSSRLRIGRVYLATANLTSHVYKNVFTFEENKKNQGFCFLYEAGFYSIWENTSPEPHWHITR